MIKVYIASPYTKGDIAVNVKRQIDTASWLMDYGFAPYVPLLCHFQHMAHPRPYEDWIRRDFIWVLKCDMLLRLEGESSGADAEVAVAKNYNIPVYYSLTELITAVQTEERRKEDLKDAY